MAIADKQKTEEEQKDEKQLELIVEELPPVRHVVRTISKMGRDDTESNPQRFVSVQTVEALLADYYANGYRLFATHSLQQDESGYGMMYVLVKE